MRIAKSPIVMILGILLASGSQSALAETHMVDAKATAFEPNVLFIEPGDSVKFTNMAGHDSVSMNDLIPEGADGWKLAMGEEGSVTLDEEGVYIYKCTPHVAMGMVAAIVVGEPTNMDEVEENASGMAKRAVIAVKQQI